jgi:hypothetical protein
MDEDQLAQVVRVAQAVCAVVLPVRTEAVMDGTAVKGREDTNRVCRLRPARLCRTFCAEGHAGAVAPVCAGMKRRGRRTVRP